MSSSFFLQARSGSTWRTAQAGTVNLGLRVASTTVAGLCGIPIAMARHTKGEIVIATKELVDNSSNPRGY